MRKASGSGDATPDGHMTQPLLATVGPSDSVLVQLQEGRKTKLSICSFHDDVYDD